MLTPDKRFVDSLQTGILITNSQLDVLYANESAANLLSSTPHSLRSLKDKVLLSVDHRHLAMKDCIHEALAAPMGDFHKTVIMQVNGQARLVFISGRLVDNRGGVQLIFCLTDITEEKECLLTGTKDTGTNQGFTRLIGHDAKIMEIYRLIEYAADSQANVLIQGESGTGKELVADAIHELSDRKSKPMIKVNCAALSETLLESELFGHEKGSFTGAYKDKTGKFELAREGTIFLDEIGEISPAIQVKLLRVIQEKTIERVGGTRPVKVDMRIIAATNKDLREMMRKGQFREDLFYRLNVFNIHMPALRQRILDIPLLVDHFIAKFNASTGKKVKGISRKAMLLMMQYPWPGNIRELQNMIEHGFVLVKGTTIELNDLPPEIKTFNPPKTLPPSGPLAPDLSYTPAYGNKIAKSRSGRLKVTKTELSDLMESYRWNQTLAASSLGISRVALWRKLKKLGLIH